MKWDLTPVAGRDHMLNLLIYNTICEQYRPGEGLNKELGFGNISVNALIRPWREVFIFQWHVALLLALSSTSRTTDFQESQPSGKLIAKALFTKSLCKSLKVQKCHEFISKARSLNTVKKFVFIYELTFRKDGAQSQKFRRGLTKTPTFYTALQSFLKSGSAIYF